MRVGRRVGRRQQVSEASRFEAAHARASKLAADTQSWRAASGCHDPTSQSETKISSQEEAPFERQVIKRPAVDVREATRYQLPYGPQHLLVRCGADTAYQWARLSDREQREASGRPEEAESDQQDDCHAENFDADAVFGQRV